MKYSPGGPALSWEPMTLPRERLEKIKRRPAEYVILIHILNALARNMDVSRYSTLDVVVEIDWLASAAPPLSISFSSDFVQSDDANDPICVNWQRKNASFHFIIPYFSINALKQGPYGLIEAECQVIICMTWCVRAWTLTALAHLWDQYVLLQCNIVSVCVRWNAILHPISAANTSRLSNCF